ncbi:MAG: DNA mismatch repair protein MutS [Halobacteriaceae archaeon]
MDEDGSNAARGDTDILGPPPEMAACESELTPMMRQYYELTAEYDDALVLFQVGDFYEAFCAAAERMARLLEITLTAREDSTGEYPMAGIPVDNAESYVETLLDAGYRVAIADQVQDPEEASGVVDRAVTRVLTPGTLTEDELLAPDDHTFVAALATDEGHYGLAVLDISTGDCYVTGLADEARVADEVGRFGPAEAVVGPEAPGDVFDRGCMVTPFEPEAFEVDRARDQVAAYYGEPDRVLGSAAEIRACGALLSYAEYARGGQDGELPHLTHVTCYDPRDYLLLDAVALESLELFERRTVHADRDHTLVGVLDETASALGSRRLRDWLRRPLLEKEAIETRLDAVEELRTDPQMRETALDRLRDVYDIERLVSRISRGRADARDLRSLRDTLAVVPELRAELAEAESDAVSELRAALDPCSEIRELIETAIQPDPPVELTEGGLIKSGYDDRLDELRTTEREGKAWVADLEAAERERTGIDSLKVDYNDVHGYYIEVTDPNLDRVPEEYERRQTLKNAERFVTPELREREDEIIQAETRAAELEYQRFVEVRQTVAEATERLQALADALARLDAVAGLSEVAATHGYTRPTFDGPGIDIEGGRHPVVERAEEEFVPNDTHLDRDRRLAVVTGPNMSGKSTYMRQVALIVLLAQAGSFVPADTADLRLVDRIFTRVGASDDIAGGRSTFMVEMTELADILREATADSLVLLDEVGRGTSTADGFALARAVTEHLHDAVGATTLFATHHHELTTVARTLPGACNRHFPATEEEAGGEGVQFSHRLQPGPATGSYGVAVARRAGLPEEVVTRAESLLEGGSSPGRSDGEGGPDSSVAAADGRGGERSEEALRQQLQQLDLARTTPMEALETLARLQADVEN